jgi:hypothetical protein
MAAFLSDLPKADVFQCLDNFSGRQGINCINHTETPTRWMPMNSDAPTFSDSTSK